MAEPATCVHEWQPLGLSTIFEPYIRHAVCFRCRTFQHETVEADSSVSRTWTTSDWPHGVWDWEEERERYGR